MVISSVTNKKIENEEEVAQNKEDSIEEVMKSTDSRDSDIHPEKIMMLTKQTPQLPKLQCPRLGFPLFHRALHGYTLINATIHDVQDRSQGCATAHRFLPNTAHVQLFKTIPKHSSTSAEI
jgi:hypothetical protein